MRALVCTLSRDTENYMLSARYSVKEVEWRWWKVCTLTL